MNLICSFVVWFLVGLGAMSVLVFLKRFVDLRRAQVDYEDFLKGVVNLLDRGRRAEAIAICEDTPSPVASVVATAIRNGRASARALREAVDSQGRAEVGRLDRRLAVLAIIAQTAPVLGFLGTALGFWQTVRAAEAVNEVISRPNLLAGVDSSLSAAVAGLVVALLTSVAYNFLRVRLERVVVELEAASSQIVVYISAQREKEAAHEKTLPKEDAK